jgi:large subunit ribosomal protein L4e
MQTNIYQLDGSSVKKEELPKIFDSEFREDLVKRALLAEQSLRYQRQGHYVLAGMQTTALYVGAYGTYRTGRHIGRAIRPRQKLASGRMGYVRRIPSSVKGKRAHPHKIEKTIIERINEREYRKAIESAIGGTKNINQIKARHSVEMQMPIVVESKLENISKSKDLILVLQNLKLDSDLKKSKDPKIRKHHNRYSVSKRYRKSMLIVANDASNIEKAGRNIPGVDVCGIKSLKVELLAPGGKPRLVIWTESALQGLEEAVSKARL